MDERRLTEQMFELWDERQARIVRGWFFENVTLSALGVEIGKSKERVRQIRRGALELATVELGLKTEPRVQTLISELETSKVLFTFHPLQVRLLLFAAGTKTYLDGKFVHLKPVGDFLEITKILAHVFRKVRDGHRVPILVATEFLSEHGILIHDDNLLSKVLESYADLEVRGDVLYLNQGSRKNEIEHLVWQQRGPMTHAELRSAYQERSRVRCALEWNDHAARESRRSSDKIVSVEYGSFAHIDHVSV